MKKFFYLVNFSYVNREGDKSDFDFGNETMIEFMNDSQLEDFELYRLFKEQGEQYIAKICNKEIEFYKSK